MQWATSARVLACQASAPLSLPLLRRVCRLNSIQERQIEQLRIRAEASAAQANHDQRQACANSRKGLHGQLAIENLSSL